MTQSEHSQGLQLQSTVTKTADGGQLEISLATIDTPSPGPDDVVVRVEASPINPSDLGLLFGPADMASTTQSGTDESPVLTAPIPQAMMGSIAARLDEAMPVGNEGAGVVVETGDSEGARALLGKTVALIGGAMYSQYRVAPAAMCLELPDGTTPTQGASCFVNPLTALGMVETMKLEGHSALVHTAAASNLGQMLNKVCLADGVALVNIVRREEQDEILRKLGAKYVCNSSSPNFKDELTDALAETGATLAFDATGGGKLGGQILACMEKALIRTASEYSRYGSTTHKQLYLYGRLDRSMTQLSGDYGMAWGIGGWLLPPFLAKIGFEGAARLRARVAAEITTTFASHYTAEVSLAEVVTLKSMAAYGKQATGEKYLINPNKGR
ncbi:MAG: zinc-binding dehydrogenase [Myxococcales bacterium]|nr:NADH oxidase [Myxococcales bacterium]HIK84171.1 NADH oxidase [Myxococcales bacterium]